MRRRASGWKIPLRRIREHLIQGCRRPPQFRGMVVPARRNTFAIGDTGMARSSEVTDVSTLAAPTSRDRSIAQVYPIGVT